MIKRPENPKQVEEMRIYKAGSKWYVQNVTFGGIEFRAKTKSACVDYIQDAARCRVIMCKDKDVNKIRVRA